MLVELLIATRIRISELCALNERSFDRGTRNLFIMGKGSKERVIQIESESTARVLSLRRGFARVPLELEGCECQ